MNTTSTSLAVSAGLRAALGYYRLVAEIGRGGMASVFLALFPNGDGTNRKIVLKQLQPELATDDNFRAMFEDEARIATRLHHDNVVETYDIYSDPDLCVLVMEFLDGQTLSRIRQRARKVGGFPLSLHLRILTEVLAALHYVHELTDHSGKALGVVHRDVTPSNVFVTYDGHAKLVDFGIAKATNRMVATQMGVLKGKLAYMSPEAVRGEPVDRRSDVFSVGVMLWEAATGLRFWQDHDEIAVFRRLATGDLPLHRRGTENAHPALLAIAKRALAIDPSRRYESAAQLQEKLDDLLVELGNVANAPALSAYLVSSFATERAKSEELIENAEAQFRKQPVSRRHPVLGSSKSHAALEPSEPPTTVSSRTGQTLRGASYDVSDPVELPNFRPRSRGFLIGAVAAALSVTVAVVANGPTQPTAWLSAVPHESSQASASGSLRSAARSADPLVSSSSTVEKPSDTANPRQLENPGATATSAVSSAIPPSSALPSPAIHPVVPTAATSEAAGKPIESPARTVKARPDKRAPETDDPWGI